MREGPIVFYTMSAHEEPGRDAHWADCQPSAEFDHCFEVTVFIKASSGTLYGYATDIENMGEFFPGMKFKRDGQGPLTVGEIYRSRLAVERTWTSYKITALEEHERVSGEQIEEHWLIKKMRFDHRFIKVEGGTLSKEKVEYSLRFGILGRTINALGLNSIVRKVNLRAHEKLKAKAASS